jgi:putative phosphoribosyl transferase
MPQNIFDAANSTSLKAEVKILTDDAMLSGELTLPKDTQCIVLLAHGSDSSRHSVRNRYVASILQSAAIGTLIFDLLSEDEAANDSHSGQLRFDIGLLAERLIQLTRWIQANPSTENLLIGYFGASTGGDAALVAAAVLGKQISSIVCRGGRIDLASDVLTAVKSPTLLIVGGFDGDVIALNHHALAQLLCDKALQIIPAASHLFEEPGKLEQVATVATDWFTRMLTAAQ